MDSLTTRLVFHVETHKNLSINKPGVELEQFIRPAAALLYILRIPDGLEKFEQLLTCLLYTSPSPRDRQKSRMPSSA